MSVTQELPKTDLSFEQKLDRLASVAVNAGLGLADGQELVMTATLERCPWRAASPSTRIEPELRW